MATWTLADIQQKIRRLTGRLSPQELPVNVLNDYINRYLQYTFPAEVKLDRNLSWYEFVTNANEFLYDAPSSFTNFIPPLTVNNFEVLWFQEPAIFYDQNPISLQQITFAEGDGVAGSFFTTVQFPPLWPGTVVITDNLETFVDENEIYSNSPVTITGSLGGTATVDYATGLIQVTFNTVPIVGAPIIATYAQFIAGRPTAVLWYRNQFRFWTVPDTSYRVRVQAYSLDLVVAQDGTVQETFQSATDRPRLDEWGPAIAFGTSRDIVAEYGEMDAYGDLTALYKEQLGYVMRRTSQNLLNTRAIPHF